MPEVLKNEDTFGVWKDKINDLVEGTVAGSFDQDIDNTSGLNFGVKEGKLRLGSTVVTIVASVVAIPASDVSIVAVYTDPSINEIRVYDELAVPTSGVIPLFKVTTDGSSITDVEDLRTWVDLSGTASESEGILTFNQDILFDKEIPDGKNALSIDPVIDSGVTVTVANGSTWVIL
ncbi:MAG: hypothetical protein R3230_00815 [Nitrosopumilaceae archaeon]|nr:hypothetical protein [Nitrosopumilaceae archaeon]